MDSQNRGPDTYVDTGVQEEGLAAGGYPGDKLDTYKGRSNTGAVLVLSPCSLHTV